MPRLGRLNQLSDRFRGENGGTVIAFGWAGSPQEVIAMGFFSRLLVPRRESATGRLQYLREDPALPKGPIAFTPCDQGALHPVDNAVYAAQRSAATAIRSGRKPKARVWNHGSCPVNHRSPDAAVSRRNG